VKYGRHWLALIVFIQFSFLTVSVVLIWLLSRSLIFFIILSIFCVLFVCMDINICKLIEKASQAHLMEERVKSVSNQVIMQASYYENLSDEIYKYRKLKHDQHNYLSVLLSLLNEGETAKAVELIQQAVGKSEALAMGYCSNIVVDSILTSNKTIACEQNIEYLIDVILDDNIGIDQIDLCSVFSNILDNAVTACKAVESGRLIMLSAAVKANYLIVRCKNTKANEIKLTNDNKLASSKGPDPEHGLGLSILGDIAQKYDGSINIKHDDKYFQITVFLMCGAQRSPV